MNFAGPGGAPSGSGCSSSGIRNGDFTRFGPPTYLPGRQLPSLSLQAQQAQQVHQHRMPVRMQQQQVRACNRLQSCLTHYSATARAGAIRNTRTVGLYQVAIAYATPTELRRSEPHLSESQRSPDLCVVYLPANCVNAVNCNRFLTIGRTRMPRRLSTCFYHCLQIPSVPRRTRS